MDRQTEAISGDFNSQDVAMCGQCASSGYSAIFLFDSVVLCLAVCRPWILMMKRVFVSWMRLASREGLHVDLSVSIQTLKEQRATFFIQYYPAYFTFSLLLLGVFWAFR